MRTENILPIQGQRRQNYRHRRRKQTGNIRIHTICTDLRKDIRHPPSFYPKHRNDRIADSAGIRLVLHTENIHVLNLDTRNLELICTSEIEQAENSATFHAAEDILHTAEEENAYIIFTSGSTGEPKGVPISRRNLNAFYTAYHRLGWQLDENDRMLQMFELTFDVSIVSFLYPLTLGACIYTVSPEGVKYINVIETLENTT